jgi:hypothetical protein
MIAGQTYGAHSAQVEMRMVVRGESLSVTHMGPDFVLIDSPADYPPCEASLVLRVDGSESVWKVRLPDGISKDSRRVVLALAE